MIISDRIANKNTFYPVFLKLKHLRVLVVGGGVCGLEKLTALLSQCPEAGITVVGESIDERIRHLAAIHPSVHLLQKAFSPGDLFDKELAIIATDDPEEKAHIHRYAKSMRVLVYVADDAILSDFLLKNTE